MKLSSTQIPIVAVTTTLLVALGGCSTIDPPRQELVEARTHLNTAKQENAEQYAALAMKRAQDRIEQAEQEMEAENFKTAKRLADEAIADLRLARVTANTEKMKQALQEIDESLKTLKSELQVES